MGKLKPIISLAALLLGFIIMVVVTYDILFHTISLGSAGTLFIGFLLFIFGFLLLVSESSEHNSVIIYDKRFAIGEKQDISPIVSQKHEYISSVIPLLNEIGEQIELQESWKYGDPIEETINLINKQLAITEYLNSTEETDGLRVVDYRSDNEIIVANSEDELSLAKGLLFNVFSDDNHCGIVNGRIGKAELIESESTSGKLFEFVITEWKDDDEHWKKNAESDLKNGYARMKILTDDVANIEKERLQTTLKTLQKIRYERGLKYDY
ncbi:hypothetical protein [Natronocalculus amylovorans]|uniref:Uncharacterized protein n=1 Tax=Natronocalculus amylovorans TaxID=2917812 RepID=A0AAE3FXH7_9EURY|nr:hypothetical protein [Natronocalculus amylovorans]MCL9817026.1 hypothetical protein [Natronocalculus amylovorans]